MANSITGSHALSIGIGVKVIANGAQCAVTVFEGARFSEDIIITLAREALRVAPETGFDIWNRPLVAYEKNLPNQPIDYTATVLFVKIKEKK